MLEHYVMKEKNTAAQQLVKRRWDKATPEDRERQADRARHATAVRVERRKVATEHTD